MAQQRQVPPTRGRPIQRPTVPGANPNEIRNEARPQTGEIAQEPINIDFDNAPLTEVIKLIGAQTGMNFDIEGNLGNSTATIISHHPVPPELAFQVLESILASRGFVMNETLDGNLIKVQAVGEGAEKLELHKGRHVPDAGFDNWSIHLIDVQYADPTSVADALLLVGSGDAKVDVYESTGTLIVRDTADGIRNMLDLLNEIDVPGSETQVEIFTLEYTRAEVIVQQIEQVLGQDTGAEQPGQPARRTITPTRTVTRTAVRAASRQSEPEVFGQSEEVLRMVPDERLNALIVVATEGLMFQVRHLIEALDTPTAYESDNFHTVELLNADAEQVEEALSGLTGSAPRQGGQAGGAQGAQGGEIQPFEKSVNITRFEQTNALLILATPQDFRKLKHIIERLDRPRRQVNIESIIMQVTINDRHELTVEAAGLTGNSGFGLNNVVNLANAIAGGPFAVAGPGTTLGYVDGTTQIPVPAGVDDMGNPTGLTLQTIPNVPLLLRALETITDVEVVSRPNLLTLDNEEASLIVGQEIPLLSSLSDTDDRTGFQSRGRIQREDVGVQLQVTPQINQGDNVSMEITVELSEPVQSSVGIDPNEVGATLNKAEVTAHVVVGDGQTGIIGGLIREGVDKTTNQAPLLGDLPLIGWLFRSRTDARNKQNLVILVTPHIIKENHDLERITQYRENEFYNRHMDVVFDKGGYIQKIRRKHYNRTEYRPSLQYREDQQSPTSPTFRRGDIRRY